MIGHFVRTAIASPGWALFAVLVVIFSVATPYFLTPFNLGNVLEQSAFIGFLALGLTPLIISGNIDLSVGSLLGLCACVAIGLEAHGLAVAIGGALVAGLVLGTLNGLIVEFVGINSFIVTLAAMLGYRGLAFVCAGGDTLSDDSGRFSVLYATGLGPFPLVSLLFIAAAFGLHWVMRNRPFGRDLYAIGGDRGAARSAGIAARTRVVACFALSGLLAALCGIAMAARLGSATPNLGHAYELWAIIAVVVGGARLRGGVGTILGTIGAVAALGVLRNGLNLTGISPFLLPAIVGIVLIAALIIDVRLHPAPRYAGE